MTTATGTETMAMAAPTIKKASKSLWGYAFSTIVKDKMALVALITVGFYFFLALSLMIGE